MPTTTCARVHTCGRTLAQGDGEGVEAAAGAAGEQDL
eukprot:CAMPEP_0203901232 /NCGR_PEP_ID=MMETSP0359-20131031/43430_1 /ASSEMBLY_ACC=CAM_ASM_000338 /TAXON_ID=268821 /ORGANISM="Scrippsiella Hangoei, Strain SHTV-5" /LENGTH=36 /DNA_ID= /DNA_START= /DNA_END= /DNA_ORIENTATION=